MFESIMRDYEKAKKPLEKQDELLKKQLQALSEPLTKKVLLGLNTNVAILHANEQLIEKESVNLIKDSAALAKETQNWLSLYNNLNETLKVKMLHISKQVGDVVNWAKVIEQDLTQLVNKMQQSENT